ncbi:MAG TPA: PP2C family protein-serine/threonine phosphatase [Rudaea sp.]
MASIPDLFDRILRLSAFDGDARAALAALHAHFAVDFPDCSLALLFVLGQPRGRCRLAGLIGPDGTEHVANLDPNDERGQLPLFDDALARDIVAGTRAHMVEVPPVRRASPFAQVLFAPASVLAVPLANRGALTHWLVFGSTLAHRFDGADLERALLHINLATSLIVRPIVLRELTLETQRQRQEIESLADIQKLLLPDSPQILGLEYAIHWQPAETAAGDYYEMTRLTEFAPPEFRHTMDVWGVIVADVSGHGAAAAMEAVQFDAILRTYQGDAGPPPAAVMTYANRYFFSRRSRGHFMTVFAVLYRPDTRILSYLSAGHPPLLHRRRNNVELFGESDQIPLGVLRDFEYRNNEITLQSGDILVLYTDGIVEARDAHDAMFGIDRLRELVASGPEQPQALLDRIVAAVHEFQQGPIGIDDQTLIVLKIAH